MAHPVSWPWGKLEVRPLLIKRRLPGGRGGEKEHRTEIPGFLSCVVSVEPLTPTVIVEEKECRSSEVKVNSWSELSPDSAVC